MYAHTNNCVQVGGGPKMAKMQRTYYMDAPMITHMVSKLEAIVENKVGEKITGITAISEQQDHNKNIWGKQEYIWETRK